MDNDDDSKNFLLLLCFQFSAASRDTGLWFMEWGGRFPFCSSARMTLDQRMNAFTIFGFPYE